MENARLITEQREALEQQTATAEVLQVINASPGNLAPVFDAILEKAHDLCDIAYGDLQRMMASTSTPLRSVAYPPGSPIDCGRDTGLPTPRRAVHCLPAAGLPTSPMRPLSTSWFSGVRSELDGLRTVVFVPLRKDGSLLGMITSAAERCVRSPTRKLRCWRTSPPRR